MAYQWDPNTIYHFVMLTPGRGRHRRRSRRWSNSLRRITPAEAAAIRPRVIDVVTVRPGDTVQSLASRMAYRDFQLDRFLALNGLAAGSRLVPGQKVKLVVYGRAASLSRRARLTIARFDVVPGCLVHMPPAPPPSALSAADHRDGDQRRDQPIFDRRRARSSSASSLRKFVRIASTPPSSGPRPRDQI